MGPQEATSTARALLDAIRRAHAESSRPVEVVLSPQGVLAMTHYFEFRDRDHGVVDLSEIEGVPCRVDQNQRDPWILVTGPRK